MVDWKIFYARRYTKQWGNVVGTINISLPDTMIGRVDNVVADLGYASRSELIRDALRSFYLEIEWNYKLTGNVLAVVTLTFNIDRRGVSEEVNRIQHKYGNFILTTLHNHIGKTCLEVLLMSGNISMIKKITDELKVVRGVETAKVSAALSFP